MKRLIVSGLSVLFLGVASASAVSGQTIAPNPVIQDQVKSTGNWLNYQYGTRIYPNGVINNPTTGLIYPSVTIKNGNGSITHYYQNGTRINTNGTTISPSGTFLIPGSRNGGLRNR
jgi:hypothetical protein